MLKLTMYAQTTIEQMEKDFHIENKICAEEECIAECLQMICEHKALLQRYDKYCADNNIDKEIYSAQSFQFDEEYYQELSTENSQPIPDDMPF